MDVHQNLTIPQRRFLACFEASASVTQAARWAKITRATHYHWLRDSGESGDYTKAFAASELIAGRTLEDEAVRRAREGVSRPVYHKGKIVGYTTEYSDSLLTTLLKGHLPKKYRDNASVELTGKDGKPLYDVASMRAYMQSVEDET